MVAGLVGNDCSCVKQNLCKRESNSISKISEKTYRILFLVDHKHRDLPGLSLIGYYLKKRGFEVKFVALWQEKELIKEFNPGFLVLPKPLYDVRRLLVYKSSGRKIIVINTEGNPQDKEFKMNIAIEPDLYFYWNQSQYNLESDLFEQSGTIREVVGCPRLDFYKKSFSGLFPSREDILQKHRLDPSNKTVTIATSTQDADFSEADLADIEKNRNKILSKTADYREIVENMRQLRQFTTDVICRLVEEFDYINIIVKPHPNENIRYWRDLVGSFDKNKPVRLCVGEPINHLLNVSDVHIALNVCTTTSEAMLSAVPTIELHSDKSEKLYDSEHLYLADFCVDNLPAALDSISKVLNIGNILEEEKENDKLNRYVSKYFFKHDGKRCLAHAESIERFARNSSQNPHSVIKFWKSNKSLFILYLLLTGRRFLGMLKRSLLVTSTNTSQQSDFVDDRGRFDNRIKQGDELYWYGKYEEEQIEHIRHNHDGKVIGRKMIN